MPASPAFSPRRRGAPSADRASARDTTRTARAAAVAVLAALAACTPPAAPGSAPTPARRRAAPPPPPEVRREFRGVWVATVANIDWPSKPGLPTAQQQGELLAILDRARALNLNAVVLQVRPAADALYESTLEPWSEYLTGQMGRAPEPRWDPLAYAVREAHARGLELHAWFNPYRARHAAARTPAAASHVSLARPELVRRYNRWQWMDPGEPGTPAHSLSVVLDVVQRYDVDGVHIDDYFYPYKEKDASGATLDFPDSASYARYQATGGTLARDDWRRDNVDTFVRALYERVKAEKPWVKVGVSPFGIWRPGHPARACCFDAHAQLYADARKWWRAGWVDYFTPQLYWSIAAPQQSYPMLLRWWAEENVQRRALWPGNYTSRVGDGSGRGYTAAELDSQVVLTRDPTLPNGGAGGNVHFSMVALMRDQGGVATHLRTRSYAAPALVPAMPWLPGRAPGRPSVAVGARGVTFAPAAGEARPWQWVVRARTDTTWHVAILPGSAAAWQAPEGVRGVPRVDEALVFAVDRTGREGPVVRVAADPLAAR